MVALVATLHGSNGTDQMEGRAMRRALWPATIGYWMDKLLAPVFRDEAVANTRRYFTEYVSGRGAAPAGKTPKESAPIDLTGYWVSIVSEDWRFRMLTPPKGDHPDFLLTPAGTKLADSWDAAKDEAEKDHCKAYGAPNIMRVPGRFHITWADDRTLKIETDAGQQTRLLRFAAAPGAPVATATGTAAGPSRQGASTAQWERKSLRVDTSNLLPGYLQYNGVPFSSGLKMVEYFAFPECSASIICSRLVPSVSAAQ